ncbi:PREDICTED: 14.7 kDa ribonuclease H-like protein [Brassica oleracea var. oleracea]|uniref:14.7 kDa ribonuclease H-like protein n=1 Tax=Brassica oleracea var. oleracea TaxID=109376 RepID=UPI0006A74AAA|nr:PREDICTED: 14.7 kDa ribonuclease H-like protein [Brassica oleracea var. oleracea]
MAKWAVELSEYDIEFKSRTSAKFQCLYVDGSSSRNRSGVGIRLISPTSEIIEQSFRLAFPASNNEAEYESLIAGLRLEKVVGVNKIETFCDSQLVANQFSGEYETRNDRMNAYLQVVQKLSQDFTNFTLTKIPRNDNSSADALAALASTSDPSLRRMIPVESINNPSIELAMGVNIIDDLGEEMDGANEIDEPTPEEEVVDPID